MDSEQERQHQLQLHQEQQAAIAAFHRDQFYQQQQQQQQQQQLHQQQHARGSPGGYSDSNGFGGDGAGGADASTTASNTPGPTTLSHSLHPLLAPAAGPSRASSSSTRPLKQKRGAGGAGAAAAPRASTSRAETPGSPVEGGKRGTKRPRPTLSCTECVRRKSKCDRVIPCSTCIKRGSPDKCKVDDEADRPSQPFAQARELASVKDRLAKVEQLLLLIAPEQAKAVFDADLEDLGPLLQSIGPAHLPPLPPIKQSESDIERAENGSDEDDGDEDSGEAEKAAFALESIAVAGRAPMNTENGLDSDSPPLTSQAKIRESQLRQQEVDFLMSMLPDWELSRSLVDAYFSKVAWQNHIVHIPTFEAQYSGLKELVEQRRIDEIDPAWLSLYFMVLACGLFFSPNRPDISPAHQAEYTHTWVHGAQRALQLADWSGRPQLTCIQSVVLLPMVLMHAGGIKRLASWIAAALRMAQLLDLHKLDDKNQHVRRAAGAAANFTPVEKEIGKRLYFSLAHGEANLGKRWLGLGDTPNANPQSIPNLLNVDDADLLASPPIPKNIEVATASSFQVIRARITTQDFNARLTGSDNRHHKYETVLAFDQRTRQLLDTLPAYFKYDRSDDPDIKEIVQSRPYIAYQRCIVLYGLNNRLLRAHRPFMSKGYFDPKFAYSTDSCIKAAKVIIAAQRALRDIFDAADRMYNCLLYCFSSAVVLLVDCFHRLASPNSITSTIELDSQRHEALDVLFMLRREASTSTIAQAGAKVLEGLLNEEGQRRAGRGLPPPSEEFTRNTVPDAEGPTLRQVVEKIASVSSSRTPGAHSGTSGTSNAGSPPTIGGAASASALAFGRSQTSPLTQSFGPMGPTSQLSRSTTHLPPLPTSAAQPSAFGHQRTASNTSTSGALSASAPSASSRLPALGLDIPSSGPGFMNNGGAFGDSLMGGDDSEDLLRSLGFFEVTGSILPSLGDGAGTGGLGDNGSGGIVGGSSFQNAFSGPGMAQDLSWLDGLGEW